MKSDQDVSDVAYPAVREQLMCLSKLILDLPLRGFIDRISVSEAVGPLLDPTAFIKGGDTLSKIKRLAVAARRFQKVVEEVRLEVQKES